MDDYIAMPPSPATSTPGITSSFFCTKSIMTGFGLKLLDDNREEMNFEILKHTKHETPVIDLNDIKSVSTDLLQLITRIHFNSTNFHESRSFENSYIPENPRTLKPLTFSKNRLRGAKNRSNTSPFKTESQTTSDTSFRLVGMGWNVMVDVIRHIGLPPMTSIMTTMVEMVSKWWRYVEIDVWASEIVGRNVLRCRRNRVQSNDE
ncbi:hypothetical protein LXL04_017353 [Taraxacum kok-saghyz]